MKSALKRAVLSSKSGMTLIEIMVVLAIIGSIAALVTVNVMDSLQESKVETTKINIRNVGSALDQYYRKHNAYPSTEQGLAALVEKPSTGKIPDNYPKKGYLKSVPKDGWGNDFVYFSPGIHGNDYEIMSYGKDGEDGGEDIDADIKSWELE